MADDDDINSEEIITEEMLWERIPEVQGLDRANTYYELSARIYARGQYDEALALAETARDIYSDLGAIAPADGLAQAYSAIGYNLNQLKRMNEAANAMSKAVDLLRETKSPMAIELACTLGEWWFNSKEYEKTIECMNLCVQEHGEQHGWMKWRNGFCDHFRLAHTFGHKWTQRVVVVPLASLSSLCVAHQK